MIPDLQNGFTKKKNKGYETRIKMAYRWKSGIVLLFLHGHDLVFDPKTLALLSRKAARSGILLLMSLKNEEVSFQFFSFFFCFCCCCSFGVSALTGAGSWVHAILIRDPLNIPNPHSKGGAHRLYKVQRKKSSKLNSWRCM